MLGLGKVRERYVLELKLQAFVMFTLFWEKREPSRKTELDKIWELSGDRRRPETATISPDQFVLANREEAELPKPSTDRAAKSSSSRGVEPLNSCPVMVVGVFFFAGMLQVKEIESLLNNILYIRPK